MKSAWLLLLVGCATTPDVDTSGSRLKLRAFDFAGAQLLTGDLFDEKLQQPCVPYEYSDNVYRCNPGSQDPTGLAVINIAAPVGDGRLQRRDYTSADGMRMLDEVVDQSLDTTCTFYGDLADGSCYPAVPGFIAYDFADAACTVPLYDDNGMTPPKAVFLGTQLYRVGDASDTVYLGPNMCMPETPAPGHGYHHLTPATMATARRVIGDQPRIATIEYIAGDTHVPENDLFDRSYNTTCTPVRCLDAVIRCVPLSGGVVDGFADASCTVPMQAIQGTCGFVAGIVGERISPMDVVARGADRVGIYQMVNGACTYKQLADEEIGRCAADAGASILGDLAVGQIVQR